MFLETYRSISTRVPPNPARNRPVVNNNAATAATSTSTATSASPSWLRQLFQPGSGGSLSDISYSWVFEVPSMSSSSSSSNRLTQKQIQEHTRSFVYNEEDAGLLVTTTCPISCSDFSTGDILCELNTCKHVFKQGEILRWFDVNTSCPVCRKPVVPITTSTESTTHQTPVLDEIVLTPVFPSSENDEMTQIMNEALESIFSGRAR